MAKYPKTQMDDSSMKFCCAKATWNKVEEVVMSYELVKQFHTKSLW